MKKIQVLTDFLEANDAVAQQNKKTFDRNKILALNLMSSPGAGKTLILEKTVETLKKDFNFAVIEGDVATTNDAKRLAKYDIPVVQITTESFGGACHLDASMVGKAMGKMDLSGVEILFIENIGNLICPAEFDLGEDRRVIVLSLTEGEDKPTKYPVAFRNADLLLVNKVDLLDYLDVDLPLLLKNAKKVNPELKVIEVSAKTGEGMDAWIAWLRKECQNKRRRTKR
ncbi:MAG: hydrogenase nickel incorporation protein HypB [Candidatus Zixiibacteriota bacterium]